MALLTGAIAVGLAAVGGPLLYANLPTRLTIGAVVPTVDYLSGAVLKKLEPGPGKDAQSIMAGANIKAGDVFRTGPTLVMAVRRPGCSLCRHQARQLCSIGPQLAERGVKVVGVVHETRGVDEFRPFLGCAEDIYFDPEKRFFGPEKRWLPFWMGFLRLSTYASSYKAWKDGVKGNTEGEGRLLGGVYLVSKDQRMVFAHLERQWGDEASPEEILAALNKL